MQPVKEQREDSAEPGFDGLWWGGAALLMALPSNPPIPGASRCSVLFFFLFLGLLFLPTHSPLSSVEAVCSESSFCPHTTLMVPATNFCSACPKAEGTQRGPQGGMATH